jgi:photosystem II stability/assembly factor-like uncharacterized protein
MDAHARHSNCRRSPDRRRLTGKCLVVLAAGLVLLLLCPAFAGAGGPAPHRSVDDWFNGVDVVGGWGWSVGTGGQVVHWAVEGAARDVWSLGASDDIQAIDMVTAKIGYVVTAAKQQGAKAGVFKTTDGGRHWTRKLTASVDVLSAVKFRTTKLGWVAGRNGTVLKTTNGGKTWATQKTKISETLYALSFPSDRVGFAVGAGGRIIKTVNAGKTWSGQDSWTTETLYGVDFVSTTTGWVVGGDTAGYCIGTTDGGKRWYAKGSGLPPLVAVDFVNATTGWVLGNEGAWPNLNGKVIKVTARGATWTDQSATVDPAPPDYGLVALKVVDAKHAYAAGESEASLSTDDGMLWHLTHIATP